MRPKECRDPTPHIQSASSQQRGQKTHKKQTPMPKTLRLLPPEGDDKATAIHASSFPAIELSISLLRERDGIWVFLFPLSFFIFNKKKKKEKDVMVTDATNTKRTALLQFSSHDDREREKRKEEEDTKNMKNKRWGSSLFSIITYKSSEQ